MKTEIIFVTAENLDEYEKKIIEVAENYSVEECEFGKEKNFYWYRAWVN